MGDDMRARLVELLNEAKTAPGAERLAALSQVKEYLIHHVPELLPAFVDEVTAFHLDLSSHTRRFVVQFVEEVVRVDVRLGRRCVGPLVLLSDPAVSAPVLKRVLLLVGTHLRRLLAGGGDAVEQLTAQCVRLVQHDNEAVRRQALKCTESICSQHARLPATIDAVLALLQHGDKLAASEVCGLVYCLQPVLLAPSALQPKAVATLVALSPDALPSALSSRDRERVVKSVVKVLSKAREALCPSLRESACAYLGHNGECVTKPLGSAKRKRPPESHNEDCNAAKHPRVTPSALPIPATPPAPATHGTQLHVPPLAQSELQTLHTETVLRIIQVDTETTGGRAALLLKVAVVSRVVASAGWNERIAGAFLDFVFADFASRHEFASRWLLEHFVADQRRKTRDYDNALQALVTRMAATQGEHDKLCKGVLLEAPVLTRPVFERIVKEWASSERAVVGVAILRDVALSARDLAAEALAALLGLTSHPHDDTRSLVIRVVAHKLFPVERLQKQVVAHALSQLKAIPKSDDSDSSIARKLLLFLALSAKQPSLLSHLAAAYTAFSPASRRVVHLQITHTVNAMPSIGVDEITNLLGSFESGSEGLVVHIVHCVVAKDGAPPALAAAVYAEFLARRHTLPHVAKLLVPVVAALRENQLVEALPDIVALPAELLKLALTSLFKDKSPIAPSTLLVAIHGLASRGGHKGRGNPAPNDPLPPPPPTTLAATIGAIQACLVLEDVFTQEVVAAAIQQLVALPKMPVACTRTIVEARARFPALEPWLCSEVLPTLVAKQPWRTSRVEWEGFKKCVQACLPRSAQCLACLPPTALADLVQTVPAAKGPLLKTPRASNVSGEAPRPVASS